MSDDSNSSASTVIENEKPAGDGTKAAPQTLAQNEADILLALQNIDLKLHKLKKQFDELPHRAKILELRTKKREVEDQIEQVTTMRVECDQAILCLQDEERAAAAHRKDVQRKIEATSNYKEAAALTRELESYAKKIARIETETLKQLEKLDKINEVSSQASTALSKLQEQETELVGEFKQQGGALKSAMAHDSSLREALASRLPVPLRTRYEKAVVAKNGVGVAYIEGDHCSACRQSYSEGQVTSLKSKGPLAECPHCHRLLATKQQVL